LKEQSGRPAASAVAMKKNDRPSTKATSAAEAGARQLFLQAIGYAAAFEFILQAPIAFVIKDGVQGAISSEERFARLRDPTRRMSDYMTTSTC
jgi:hypothetical protein